MIRAFENGKTTRQIAEFFGLDLREVVDTIYSQQKEWTVSTTARFANTTEDEISAVLREARSILDSGTGFQLEKYAEGYQRKLSASWARGYVVGMEMGILEGSYRYYKELDDTTEIPTRSVAFQVAWRRLELLIFMHQNDCSLEEISIALGISEENAECLIEAIQKIDSELEERDMKVEQISI